MRCIWGGRWRWIWREKLPRAQICSSVAISRCPRGIRARHRLLETRPYNGSCVVSSALEHGTGASPHETTGSPSLGWARGFSEKNQHRDGKKTPVVRALSEAASFNFFSTPGCDCDQHDAAVRFLMYSSRSLHFYLPIICFYSIRNLTNIDQNLV